MPPKFHGDKMLITRLFKYYTYQIFAPGALLRSRYEAFKLLLRHDKAAHEYMAELQEIHYGERLADFTRVTSRYKKLSASVKAMIEAFFEIAPASHLDILDYYKKIDFYALLALSQPQPTFAPPFVAPLELGHELSAKEVGGKANNLFLISQKLALPVPNGFAITTNAFNYLIEYNDLRYQLDDILSEVDVADRNGLEQASNQLKTLFLHASMPPILNNEVKTYVEQLKKQTKNEIRLAVRSSAVGEDSELSFAGQYDTILNVQPEHVLHAYLRVIASKYTPRAISYRIKYGIPDTALPMACVVLQQIDATASGVMTTCDMENKDCNTIAIHAVQGSGERLVEGFFSPNVYKLDKDSLALISNETHAQSHVTLLPEHLNILGSWAVKIEEFYEVHQEIEWCMDNQGRLWCLQSRPLVMDHCDRENVEKNIQPRDCLATFESDISLAFAGGKTASRGLGAGRICIIEGGHGLDAVKAGDVLVALHAMPAYAEVMGRISALVTEVGSPLSHLAAVAREFSVPTIMEAKGAIKILGELGHGQNVVVVADDCKIFTTDEKTCEKIQKSCVITRKQRDKASQSNKLDAFMKHVTPLRLTNPNSDNFKPSGCRSFHDIVRFIHEKAMHQMFVGVDARGPGGGSRKLATNLPVDIYLVDVGRGINNPDKHTTDYVSIQNLNCKPLKALLDGISHPEIVWEGQTHFDWKGFDDVVAGGGVASHDSALFASYAVISEDYLNLNIKFGFHFTIIDTLCSDMPDENYVLLRFAGGGADMKHKLLRLDFIEHILTHLGYDVERKGDNLNAQLQRIEAQRLEQVLDMTGRLLGATRLLDMAVPEHDTEAVVNALVKRFLSGKYDLKQFLEANMTS